MAATLFTQSIQLLEDEEGGGGGVGEEQHAVHPEHAGVVPLGLAAQLSSLSLLPVDEDDESPSGGGGEDIFFGASNGRIGSVDLLVSELDNPAAPCLKEGFLSKVGSFVKSWKPRYFRLTPGRLSYYSNGEAGASRLGSILLPQAMLAVFASDVFPTHDFCFGVTPADGERQYILEADTASHRAEWLRALAEPVRQRLRAHRDSVREGWLVKRGSVVRNFKRRYFVLRHGSLVYQAHFTDVALLGTIDLTRGFMIAAEEDEAAVARVMAAGGGGAASSSSSQPSSPNAAASSSSSSAAGANAEPQLSSTPFGFLLRAHGAERVYRFLTSTKQDRDGWIRALMDVAREGREMSASVGKKK